MRTLAVAAALLAIALAPLPALAVPRPSDPVAAALKAAGRNRPQIEKVLAHYAGDARKLDAARWLIGNMVGKGYRVVSVVDGRGADVGFDCLKFPDLNTALNAYDALEKKHGTLTDKVVPHPDLREVSAEFLIGHIDGAFEAWQTLPWARDVSYETFRAYVLPYRGGSEPAEAWRPELMARYAGIAAKMDHPGDLREAAGRIQGDLNAWVGFWDLYYMHPTEQGFAEMKRSRKGRCGDLSNLATMALRSNGIPCAIDYTPYWADTGNNHAWPVVLDRNGEGRDAVGKAAKVYRKTFGDQADSLYYDAKRGEPLPPWLSRPGYVDVTRQYLPTTDVAFTVRGRKAAHAYLCVFNDGDWRAIQWGAVGAAGDTTFRAMGRAILYLPATFGRRGVEPAGVPFILTGEGNVRPLTPCSALPMRLTVGATTRGAGDYRLTNGRTYELSVWDGGWKALGKQVASGKPLVFEGVPSGALYWLVEEGSRREERPFVVEDGKPAWL